MKKTLSIITLAMVAALTLCLVGCGSSSQSSAASDDFNSAKDNLVSQIDAMNTASKNVAATELKIWDVTGADNFAAFTSTLLSISDMNSYNKAIYNQSKIMSQYHGYIDEVFGTNIKKSKNRDAELQEINKALNYINEFRTNYEMVNKTNTELQSAVKDFKDKYSDKHADSVSAIVDYYLASSNLADAVLNPTGSYVTFSKNINDLIAEIDSLKKKVDLS